jgi:hypothetical protein
MLDRSMQPTSEYLSAEDIRIDNDNVNDDVRDPSWATVLKRSFEAYVRGERPNMVRQIHANRLKGILLTPSQYGEWIRF